jgi:hypothetical protein
MCIIEGFRKVSFAYLFQTFHEVMLNFLDRAAIVPKPILGIDGYHKENYFIDNHF